MPEPLVKRVLVLLREAEELLEKSIGRENRTLPVARRVVVVEGWEQGWD